MNFQVDVSTFRKALDVHRSLEKDIQFIAICEAESQDMCSEIGADKDVFLASLDLTSEERFALLSSCHSNVISNDLTFFATLLNNGKATIISNFSTGRKYKDLPGPEWFVMKRKEWTVVQANHEVPLYEY